MRFKPARSVSSNLAFGVYIWPWVLVNTRGEFDHGLSRRSRRWSAWGSSRLATARRHLVVLIKPRTSGATYRNIGSDIDAAVAAAVKAWNPRRR